MQTSTASTCTGPAMTLDSLVRAIEQVQKVLTLPPPPVEIRLHPEDLREQLRAGENVFAHEGQLYATANKFLGLPVIEDPEAPRLPRKAR